MTKIAVRSLLFALFIVLFTGTLKASLSGSFAICWPGFPVAIGLFVVAALMRPGRNR